MSAPDAEAARNVFSIYGPIISTNDPCSHIRLFEAFGLREIGRIHRTAKDTLAIWSIPGHSCLEIMLETPGTAFGIRLLCFDPGSPIQIRDPARGSDSEALKVIDFYAPDLAAALSVIERAGFTFKPVVADYETPEGRYQEAHLWGPDGVVCALISGDAALFTDLATVRDRLVSEPQSISGPVQDPAATLAFFEETLGLGVIHRYGLEDPSFDALVGTADQMTLRAWNVGVRKTEPYFGIIHYGLPPGSQSTLREASRPPARGLLGATLRANDVAAIAIKAGVPVVATTMPGFGAVKVATLQGPNGAWFQAVQAEH